MRRSLKHTQRVLGLGLRSDLCWSGCVCWVWWNLWSRGCWQLPLWTGTSGLVGRQPAWLPAPWSTMDQVKCWIKENREQDTTWPLWFLKTMFTCKKDVHPHYLFQAVFLKIFVHTEMPDWLARTKLCFHSALFDIEVLLLIYSISLFLLSGKFKTDHVS